MPSIIGSSLIFNNDLVITTITGPTGPIGSVGPVGSTGSTGITKGNTGNIGVYIKDVISNTITDTISFVLSDDAVISYTGFKGPTYGTYKDSRGVSTSISSEYISIFSEILSGETFSFFGISGTNDTGVIPYFSENNTKILLNFTNINPIVGLCGSASGYALYINDDKNISVSSIGVTSSYLTPLPPEIAGITPSNFLNFNSINSVKGITNIENYIDVDHKIYTVSPFYKNTPYTGIIDDVIVSADPLKGLDIVISDKYSAYYFQTPVGINSITFAPSRSGSIKTPTRSVREGTFIGDPRPGSDEINPTWVVESANKVEKALEHVVFFINGTSVWNFPKDVMLFDNIKKIYESTYFKEHTFSPSLNILNIYRDTYSGLKYINFFHTNYGYTGPQYINGDGSCCYVDDAGVPQCLDYSSYEECSVIGGNFKPLETCKNACVEYTDGYCCHPTVGCSINVNPEICTSMGGTWVQTPTLEEAIAAGDPLVLSFGELENNSVPWTYYYCQKNCNFSEVQSGRAELEKNFLNSDPGPSLRGNLLGVNYPAAVFSSRCTTNFTIINFTEKLIGDFNIKTPVLGGIRLSFQRPAFTIQGTYYYVEAIDLFDYVTIKCVGCGPLGEDIIVSDRNHLFYNNQRVQLILNANYEKGRELITKLQQWPWGTSYTFDRYTRIIYTFFAYIRPTDPTTAFTFFITTDLTHPPILTSEDLINSSSLDYSKFYDNRIFWHFALRPPLDIGRTCIDNENTLYHQGTFEVTNKCLFCQDIGGNMLPLQKTFGTISACISTDPSFYWTDPSTGKKKYHKINCIRGLTAININSCKNSIYNNTDNSSSNRTEHILYENILPLYERTGYFEQEIPRTDGVPGLKWEVGVNKNDCQPGDSCYETILYDDGTNPPILANKGYLNGDFYYNEIKTTIKDFAIANLPAGSTLPDIIVKDIEEELLGLTFTYVYKVGEGAPGIEDILIPNTKFLFTYEGSNAHIINDNLYTDTDPSKGCCSKEQYYGVNNNDLLKLPLNPCKCAGPDEQSHLGPPDQSIYNFNGHKAQELEFATSDPTSASPELDILEFISGTDGDTTYDLNALAPSVEDFTEISGGYWHAIGIENGTKKIYAWGAGSIPTNETIQTLQSAQDKISLEQGQSAIPVSLQSKQFSKVSAGPFHTVALDTDGKVYCWGAGLIIDSDDIVSVHRGQSIVPSDLYDNNTIVIDISAGGYHTVVLTLNTVTLERNVRAWGWNRYGQCNVLTGRQGIIKAWSEARIYAGPLYSFWLNWDPYEVWLSYGEFCGKNYAPTTIENSGNNFEMRYIVGFRKNLIKKIVTGIDYITVHADPTLMKEWKEATRIRDMRSEQALEEWRQYWESGRVNLEKGIVHYGRGNPLVGEADDPVIDIAGNRYAPVLLNNKGGIEKYLTYRPPTGDDTSRLEYIQTLDTTTNLPSDKEFNYKLLAATNRFIFASKQEQLFVDEYEYWVYATHSSTHNQCTMPYKCSVPCAGPLCQGTEEDDYQTGFVNKFKQKTSVNIVLFKIKIDPSGNPVNQTPECVLIKPGCFWMYGVEFSKDLFSGIGTNCFIDYSSPDYDCNDNGGFIGINENNSNSSFRYIGRIKKNQTTPVPFKSNSGYITMTPGWAGLVQNIGPYIGNASSTDDGCWWTIAGMDGYCNGQRGLISGGMPCVATKTCNDEIAPDVCYNAARWMIEFNDSYTNSPYIIDLNEFKNSDNSPMTTSQIKLVKYAKEQYFKNNLLSYICKPKTIPPFYSGALPSDSANIANELKEIVCVTPGSTACNGGGFDPFASGFYSNIQELGLSVDTFCSENIMNNFDNYEIIIDVQKQKDVNGDWLITPTIFKIEKNNPNNIIEDTDSYLYRFGGADPAIILIKSRETFTLPANNGYSQQLVFLYKNGENVEFGENTKQIRSHIILDLIDSGDILVSDLGLGIKTIIQNYSPGPLGFNDSTISLDFKSTGSFDLVDNLLKTRLKDKYNSFSIDAVYYNIFKPRNTGIPGSRNTVESVECNGCAYGTCFNARLCVGGLFSESKFDRGFLDIFPDGLGLEDGVDSLGRLYVDALIAYAYTINVTNDFGDIIPINRVFSSYKKEELYFENNNRIKLTGLNIDGECVCVDCQDPSNIELCTKYRYCNSSGECAS